MELQLTDKIYTMQQNLIIANFTNFFIVGHESVLNCQNESKFSLSINNSSFVQISSIKFINCGNEVNNIAGLLHYMQVLLCTCTTAHQSILYI